MRWAAGASGRERHLCLQTFEGLLACSATTPTTPPRRLPCRRAHGKRFSGTWFRGSTPPTARKTLRRWLQTTHPQRRTIGAPQAPPPPQHEGTGHEGGKRKSRGNGAKRAHGEGSAPREKGTLRTPQGKNPRSNCTWREKRKGPQRYRWNTPQEQEQWQRPTEGRRAGCKSLQPAGQTPPYPRTWNQRKPPHHAQPTTLPPRGAPEPGEGGPSGDATAPGHGPQRGTTPRTHACHARPAVPARPEATPAASTTPSHAHQPPAIPQSERGTPTKGDTKNGTPPEPKPQHPRQQPRPPSAPGASTRTQGH